MGTNIVFYDNYINILKSKTKKTPQLLEAS